METKKARSMSATTDLMIGQGRSNQSLDLVLESAKEGIILCGPVAWSHGYGVVLP